MERSEMVPYVQNVVRRLYESYKLTGTYIIHFDTLSRIPDSDMNEVIYVYAFPVSRRISPEETRYLPHIEILGDTLPPGIISYDFEVTIGEVETGPSQCEADIRINENNIRLSPPVKNV